MQVYDSSLGDTANFVFEEPLVHLEPPEILQDAVIPEEEPIDAHLSAPAPPAIFTQGSVDFLAGESPLSMPLPLLKMAMQWAAFLMLRWKMHQ